MSTTEPTKVMYEEEFLLFAMSVVATRVGDDWVPQITIVTPAREGVVKRERIRLSSEKTKEEALDSAKQYLKLKAFW